MPGKFEIHQKGSRWYVRVLNPDGAPVVVSDSYGTRESLVEALLRGDVRAKKAPVKKGLAAAKKAVAKKAAPAKKALPAKRVPPKPPKRRSLNPGYLKKK